MLRGLGAEPVMADVLDAEAIGSVVAAASPRRSSTRRPPWRAISTSRHFDRSFADDEPAAKRGHRQPARRRSRRRHPPFVAQSFGGWSSAPANSGRRRGGRDPRRRQAGADAARRSPRSPISRRQSAGSTGPTASSCATAGSTGPAPAAGRSPRPADRGDRERKFPIIGDGGGVWSFIHVADAADATVEALERGAPGIYNIVDDDPAAGPGVAAEGRRGGRREAAEADPEAGSEGSRRRARGRHDDRRARRLERKGEARARLDARAPELAHGRCGGQ